MLVLSGPSHVSRGKGAGWEVSHTKKDTPGSWPRIRIVMLPEPEGEGGKVAVPFELALFAHVPDVGDFGELGWVEEVGGGCGCHGVGIDEVQGRSIWFQKTGEGITSTCFLFCKKKRDTSKKRYLSHMDSHHLVARRRGGGGITDHMEA